MDTVYVCKKIWLSRVEGSDHQALSSTVRSNMELAMLRVFRLIHPNIMRVHKVLIRPQSDSSSILYYIMDYFPLGSILDRLNQLASPIHPEEQAKMWFTQVLGAVAYVHSKGMAHRNIKLSTMLLESNDTAILCGFEFNCIASRRDHDIMRLTSIGNIEYMAPEMHSPCVKIWPYNAKSSDMYAMGVCLFRMVNYDPPFDASHYDANPMSYVYKQRTQDYRYRKGTVARGKTRHLIARLLDPMPGTRITAESALLHDALSPSVI